MGRLAQVIVFERVREVYDFMMNGSKQTKDILHFFSEKWTIDGYFKKDQKDISKHRTIANYIKKAKDMFFNFEKDAEIEKSRTLARLDDLYMNMMKIQDFKGAITVLKEIREIVGFTAPKGVQVEKEEDNDIICELG